MYFNIFNQNSSICMYKKEIYLSNKNHHCKNMLYPDKWQFHTRALVNHLFIYKKVVHSLFCK